MDRHYFDQVWSLILYVSKWYLRVTPHLIKVSICTNIKICHLIIKLCPEQAKSKQIEAATCTNTEPKSGYYIGLCMSPSWQEQNGSWRQRQYLCSTGETQSDKPVVSRYPPGATWSVAIGQRLRRPRWR